MKKLLLSCLLFCSLNAAVAPVSFKYESSLRQMYECPPNFRPEERDMMALQVNQWLMTISYLLKNNKLQLEQSDEQYIEMIAGMAFEVVTWPQDIDVNYKLAEIFK